MGEEAGRFARCVGIDEPGVGVIDQGGQR